MLSNCKNATFGTIVRRMGRSIYQLLGVASLIMITATKDSDWPRSLDNLIYSDCYKFQEICYCDQLNCAPKSDHCHISQINVANSLWNDPVLPQQNSSDPKEVAVQFLHNMGFSRTATNCLIFNRVIHADVANIERKVKSQFQYLLRIFHTGQLIGRKLGETLDFSATKIDDNIEYAVNTARKGLSGLFMVAGYVIGSTDQPPKK